MELKHLEGVESMIISEGMELVVMFIVIMLNLFILVWLQKWSGLT
jgi:hypothetical protein